MFFTEEKLEKRLEEIKKYRYKHIHSLEEFQVREDKEGIPNPAVPTDHQGWDLLKTGDLWKGRDRYLWMYREIQLPETDAVLTGIFDLGKTGGGNNSGFEAMCYLNGAPYQGVDINHQEVFFPKELYGTKVALTFRLWSGLEGGGIPTEQEHRINRADLAELDEAADDLYYTGTVLLEVIRKLGEMDPLKFDLRKLLDQSFLSIDWSYPGSPEFYASLLETSKILNQKLDHVEKHSPITVHCVGHTHIDMAWLWRLKHTREKGSRSFSTVLRLMERFPEYIFLQTQPQLYAYIKEDFPEIYEKIKERVKEGRWEPDGAMWVEADCNLTGGESLTRQILQGSRFFQEEFGKNVEYLWLPDVFGYSWALPQILKKSGIDMFMTTKISWNEVNRMPHDTFRWRGIDGSEVLTHFITTPDAGTEQGNWYYTYNGCLTADTVQGVWDAYRDKEMNKDLLISYGFGDGGGGVNRDLLERRRRLDRIPGIPHVKTSTAGAYFRKLKETVKNTDSEVSTWDGELYLEFHRGTYTSQAHNKKMNRKMELLYRNAEWMTAMKGVNHQDLTQALQEELTKGWKKILTNQFHDIIPGSSIHEVYEDSRKDYKYIEETARNVLDSYFETELSQEENCFTVYNSSGWDRSTSVFLPVTDEGTFTDLHGSLLPAQKTKTGTYVQVSHIPAMGYTTIRFQKGGKPDEKQPFHVDERQIETPFYKLVLNEAGQILSLYDKENAREVLAEGECGNVLQIFEDKPVQYDAWNIDLFYQQKMKEITHLESCTIKEQGPLRLVINLNWKYMNSSICQDMIFYADHRRIDFQTTVDYQERQQLLKVAFPVNIRSTYALYDIQYGNVRRPNHWNTSWDEARFESVGHRFADLSERNYGVALLNDCKYGYDVKDHVLRLSLIRSAKHPDYLQDVGIHHFTYSLLPHKGDFVDGSVVQEAVDLNDPVPAAAGKEMVEEKSFFTLDNDQVEVDAVKKSEDGNALIIRFHDFAGSSQTVTLKPDFDFSAWAECDLRERPYEDLRKDPILLELHPYEIKTVLLVL